VRRAAAGDSPGRPGWLGDLAQPLAWIAVPLLLWEVAVRLFRVPDFILPLPSQVALRLVADRDTLLLQAARSTLLILEGFLLGAVPGLAVGLAIASSRLLEKALYPLIVFVQTTPQIAIAPLLIVWFGYGALPKVLLAAMLTFFPVLVDSSTGFKTIDRRLFHVSRSMGASRWQTFARIQLPSALPLILSGCRISILTAVTVVIVVEFLSSNEGLGFVAVRALSNQDLSLMFAAIFVAIAIGLALSYLVDVGELLLLPWERIRRRDAAFEQA
jgi:NitT/TauT family transport system permease protein